MPAQTPSVVLHIGRNKAGSTSIQTFCARQEAWLGAHGIHHARFGHMARAGGAAAMRDAPTVPDLARIAQAMAPARVLISNEFMVGWPDEYTEALARDLRGIEARILIYVRAYPEWVASTYAQAVANGETHWDFSTYLAKFTPRISFRPILAAYARCFGWDRIAVRGFEAALSAPGGLIGDFCAALGLPAPPCAETVHENAAPSWPVLETLRQRVPHDMNEAGWDDADRAAVTAWLLALSAAATAHGFPRLRYGSAPERRRLAARFEQDRA